MDQRHRYWHNLLPIVGTAVVIAPPLVGWGLFGTIVSIDPVILGNPDLGNALAARIFASRLTFVVASAALVSAAVLTHLIYVGALAHYFRFCRQYSKHRLCPCLWVILGNLIPVATFAWAWCHTYYESNPQQRVGDGLYSFAIASFLEELELLEHSFCGAQTTLLPELLRGLLGESDRGSACPPIVSTRVIFSLTRYLNAFMMGAMAALCLGFSVSLWAYYPKHVKKARARSLDDQEVWLLRFLCAGALMLGLGTVTTAALFRLPMPFLDATQADSFVRFAVATATTNGTIFSLLLLATYGPASGVVASRRRSLPADGGTVETRLARFALVVAPGILGPIVGWLTGLFGAGQ